MSVSISGILLDPYGQPARFAEVKFITWQGAADVLTTSNSVFKTSEDGAYAFSVEFGTFTVQVRYNQSNGKFQTIKQKVIVNSTTTASTLGALLLFNEPLTPPEIAYVEQLVAEAEGYRDESEVFALASEASSQASNGFSQSSNGYADDAAASAAAAATSAESIAGVPLNGGVWAAGIAFNSYNEYMIYNGLAYAPLAATTLPYVSTAIPDQLFVGAYPLGVIYEYIAVADMKIDANLGASLTGSNTITINTKDHYSSQRGGGAKYLFKTFTQATADGDAYSATSLGNIQCVNGVAVLQGEFISNVLCHGAQPNVTTFNSLPSFLSVFAMIVRGEVKVPGLPNSEQTIYYVASPLEVPHQVNLIGDARGSSRIYAMAAGFSGAHVVRLGAAAATVVTGCTAQYLTIDPNGNTGVVGGYSNSINESSGFRDCLLVGDSAPALIIDEANSGSPKNFELNRVSLVVKNATGAGDSVAEISASHARDISSLTLVGDNFGGTPTENGLKLGGTLKAPVSGIHCEGSDNGVLLDSVNGITINGVTGGGVSSGAITNLVTITSNASNQNITLQSIVKRNATNAINDLQNSNTITDDAVASYSIGQGSVGQRHISSSSNQAESVIYGQEMQGGTALRSFRSTTNYNIDGSSTFYEGRNATITAIIQDLDTSNDRRVVRFDVIHTGSGATTLDTASNTLYDESGSVVPSFLMVANRVYTLTGVVFGASGRWYIR